MKKIIGLLAGSLLFANLYNYTPNVKIKKENIPLSLKFSMNSTIQSISISKNHIAIGSYSTEKIFNLNGNLENSFHYNDLKTIKIANNKLFILTRYNLLTFDLSQNYKILSNIKSTDYQYLDTTKELLGVVKGYYYAYIYNLQSGKKISNFSINYKWLKFSPNGKKIISDNRIYDINGNLLVDLGINFHSIDWIDNNKLAYIHNNKLFIIDSLSTQKEGPFLNKVNEDEKSRIDKVIRLNNQYMLVLYHNTATIFDTKNKKFLPKIFMLNNTPNEEINNVDLNNNILILTFEYSHSNSAYIYDITPILKYININHSQKIDNKRLDTNPTNNKSKTIIKTKIIEKKIYIKENKKPNLVVYASQTTGYAPLEVKFKILASDEDGKIIAYYINFAGKELLKKGSPDGKTFKYVFTQPGEYKILVAVKDDKGAITKQILTIKVKEESFEEYKKHLLGD